MPTPKPHIYKYRGKWWIECRHPKLEGPYYEFIYAAIAAGLIWFEGKHL